MQSSCVDNPYHAVGEEESRKEYGKRRAAHVFEEHVAVGNRHDEPKIFR
jgi:hypothetical protein